MFITTHKEISQIKQVYKEVNTELEKTKNKRDLVSMNKHAIQ